MTFLATEVNVHFLTSYQPYSYFFLSVQVYQIWIATSNEFVLKCTPIFFTGWCDLYYDYMYLIFFKCYNRIIIFYFHY